MPRPDWMSSPRQLAAAPCAPRFAIVAIALFGAIGCSSANVERQRLADGSWKVTCKLPMEDCVRQLEMVCSEKRYQILNGGSRLRRYGVEPSILEIRSSDLTFRCTSADESTAPVAPADAGLAPPATSADPARVQGSTSTGPDAGTGDGSTPSSASRVCTPGATQMCVGARACAGGQACRPDGLGFGPCDCGAPSTVTVDAGAKNDAR